MSIREALWENDSDRMQKIADPHPDPVVEWFLNNDPAADNLLRALQRIPDPSPKVRGLTALHAAFMGLVPIEVALKDLGPAVEERSHVDLHIMFLLTWMRLLSFNIRGDFTQVEILSRQVAELTSDSTPVVLRSFFGVTQAHIALNAGMTLAFEKLGKDALGLLPKTSAHHAMAEFYVFIGYSRLGLNNTFGRVTVPVGPTKTDDGPPTFNVRTLPFLYIDFVIRGEVEKAQRMAEILTPYTKQLSSFTSSKDYRVAQLTHRLIVSGRQEPIELTDFKSEQAWVESTRALSVGDGKRALEWARFYAAQERSERTIVGFDEYALIRAELAVGNADAALRLIGQRHELGTYHYIDNLFIARAQLMRGERATAAQSFLSLHSDVERYGAKGRLKFELSLAPELSISDMVDRLGAKLTPAPVAEIEDTQPKEESFLGKRRAKRDTGRVVFASGEKMRSAVDLVKRFADTDAPVLITGETGTGKEVIARELHEKSARRNRPFIPVNCAAIAEALVESELFGHTRGAFTGAQVSRKGLFLDAGDGTIFLDEIGEVSARTQVALLRVLECGEVRPVGSSHSIPIRCRVIAATNANLTALVQQGRFRSDLIYRLERLQIHLAPLKERSDDILQLAQYFLDIGREEGQSAIVSEAFKQKILEYQWPGNVRELRNVIERMRVLNSDKISYDAQDLELGVSSRREPAAIVQVPSERSTAADSTPQAARPVPLQTKQPIDETAGGEGLSNGRKNNLAIDNVEGFLRSQNSALRRLERIRDLFREHKTLKAYEVAEITGISRVTASRYLLKLREEGFIKKIEPTLSSQSHYFVLNGGEEQ